MVKLRCIWELGPQRAKQPFVPTIRMMLDDLTARAMPPQLDSPEDPNDPTPA
jgi:hypothetical protein